MNPVDDQTVIVVQARMGSTRLPGKVLRPLAGRPMLSHLAERLAHCQEADRVVIATTELPEDEAIVRLCAEEGIAVHTGPGDDVLARYVGAAVAAGATTVVRVTGDCPLIEPTAIDASIGWFRTHDIDYLSAGTASGLPRGLDHEVFTVEALLKADQLDDDPLTREHVTLEIYHNPDIFRTMLWPAPAALRRPGWRLCVDEEADLRLVETIYDRLWEPGRIITFDQVAALLDADPALAASNAEVRQRTYPGAGRPGPQAAVTR
jgi:spore coat polysaccharide biosynthesis protein SpsF